MIGRGRGILSHNGEGKAHQIANPKNVLRRRISSPYIICAGRNSNITEGSKKGDILRQRKKETIRAPAAQDLRT
jgi:hypothetical protein